MGRAGSGAGQSEGGQAGGENTILLGGYVTVYGTEFIRWGGNTDANPFRYIQYPERTERMFEVGVNRDGIIQCGC